MSHGTCSYIRVYTNTVAGTFMLCLQHGFYNITQFLKSNINYIDPQGQPPPPPRRDSGRAPA
jgi:hypothetical protein